MLRVCAELLALLFGRRLAETEQLVFLGGVRDWDPRGFFELVDFVCGETFEFLGEAAGPADFDGIELGDGAEAEVHAHVVIGIVARAAADFVDEDARAGLDSDASANAVAIGA